MEALMSGNQKLATYNPKTETVTIHDELLRQELNADGIRIPEYARQHFGNKTEIWPGDKHFGRALRDFGLHQCGGSDWKPVTQIARRSLPCAREALPLRSESPPPIGLRNGS